MCAADRFVRILDTSARVWCPDPEVGELLDRLLAPFLVREVVGFQAGHTLSLTPAPTEEAYLLSRNGEPAARVPSRESAVTWLLAELNRTVLEECRAFAVHAGVVSHQGEVVAFPAESGGGKSTLTAACLLAGSEYVSDEALCASFDSQEVIPYPKPIILTAWSLERLGIEPPSWGRDDEENPLSADQLAATIASGRLRLAHVVLPIRRPGPPELAELPRSEAISWLLRFSFNHYKWPAESFRLVTELARGCRAWTFGYAEPAAAGALIRRQLGG